MFWGDSISSIFGNKWQNAFIARTGAVYYGQDARPGRAWGSMLEGYGAYCPLASLGSLGAFNANTDTNHTPQCSFPTGGVIGNYGTYTVPVTGQTLAQTLANVDLLVIVLGTNDASTSFGPIGNITDGYTAGTEYASMNFALDAVYTAKPTIKVVIVTPYFFGNGADITGANATASDGSGSTLVYTQGTTNSLAAAAKIQALVNAEIAVGNARGIPVLNMLSNGNINALNIGKQTRDSIHPTDLYMNTVMGPLAAQFSIQRF